MSRQTTFTSVTLSDVHLTEEDIVAVLDTYRAGWLTMGPRSQAFEAAFAELVGSAHAVAVASGTAALHLALLALGIGEGDEVIVPALTFVAGAGTVVMTGATPVLADIVSATDHNIDPEAVRAAITPRTKAILATHWWGVPCDLAALQALCDEHGLVLVEDAAQAILADAGAGRRVGTVGSVGCYSLFSKKQLCVGEGGVVVTDDEALAARVRSLRSHAMTSVTWDRHRGHAESYDIVDIGYNYRLDEPRSALALSRMARLPAEIESRRALAERYRTRLRDLDGITLVWDDDDVVARSSHFAFGLVVDDGREARDAVRAAMAAEGVQTTWYPALSTLSAYRELGPAPRAEDAGFRQVVLPMSPSYGEVEVEAVALALERAVSA